MEQQIQQQDDAKTKPRFWFNFGRTINLGEFIGGLVVIAYSYFNIEKRITLLEAESSRDKAAFIEFKETVKKDNTEIKLDLKELNRGQNEIKVLLQDKLNK
mgnify:FL=1